MISFGPLLFGNNINDLAKGICDISKFIDYTKIGKYER